MRTLTGMSKLRSVPGWVRPPLRSVSATEAFLLWLFGRTRSPDVLGAWTCLSWLGAEEGEQTPGPLVRRGLPTEVAAWTDMYVANQIAEGKPYPPSSWWASHGIDVRDRMTPQQWAERAGSLYERLHAHGTAVALAWLLGKVDDPTLMAPIRDGDGRLIPSADRDEYSSVLLRLSATPA